MTVSSTTTKNSYSGDGSQTVFAYTFKIFDDDDITVIVRSSAGTEVVQTKTTHYSVSDVGNANGGNVTFVTAPASGETVVLLRDTALTQTTDYTPNDPFPASAHEDALDRITFQAQEIQEELDRAIKVSRTNSLTSSEFTLDAATRANKIFAFDSNGDFAVTQEIGTYKGTDATTTTAAYKERDLVKSTTAAQLDNVYICVADSVIGDLLTDTDHFELVVDAVSAATSATNAATSATNAATSATNASTSATNAATSETNAATSETNAATSATNAATSATNAATSETNAANSATAAEATFDLFDDSYLGAKTSNPSVDNDGNALQDGALYFDTTNNVMKVYDLGTTTWFQLTPTVSNQTNINTVAGIASDVTTVAGISSNVTTVSGISADVTTVAADGTDIGTVATNISNVNSVAGNSTNINTVAGISSNVTTVAGISANVTTVSGISADVTTVAGDAADIATVAGISSDVSAVGAVAANVTTVANNLTDINSFANTYFISATAPSSPTEGDLWFDTTNDIMKVYDGSGFVNAGSSVNGTANRVVYTATAGQTTFSATYDAGYVDVYLNGVKLIAGTDFTATDGTSVVLASGAALNDTVDIVAYGTFNLLSTGINDLTDVNTSGITNGQVLAYNSTSTNFEPTTITSDLVDDTTPQLGGNLDVQTHSIVSTSNRDINITPNGTGNVNLGNFTFDADQTVGAGQDNYLLTYDHSTTSISLEAAPAGGAGYFQGENGATGDTTNGKGDIFRVHEQQLDTNTTIAAGDNAGAFFSLTVATGVTLTVNGNLVIA